MCTFGGCARYSKKCGTNRLRLSVTSADDCRIPMTRCPPTRRATRSVRSSSVTPLLDVYVWRVRSLLEEVRHQSTQVVGHQRGRLPDTHDALPPYAARDAFSPFVLCYSAPRCVRLAGALATRRSAARIDSGCRSPARTIPGYP